jgi:hypothetical protein
MLDNQISIGRKPYKIPLVLAVPRLLHCCCRRASASCSSPACIQCHDSTLKHISSCTLSPFQKPSSYRRVRRPYHRQLFRELRTYTTNTSLQASSRYEPYRVGVVISIHRCSACVERLRSRQVHQLDQPNQQPF